MAQKPGKPRHGAKLKRNAGIALDPDTIAALDSLAKKLKISRSELVGMLIKKHLPRLGQELEN